MSSQRAHSVISRVHVSATLRPELKLALADLAAREDRTISYYMEKAVIMYLEARGIQIPDNQFNGE